MFERRPRGTIATSIVLAGTLALASPAAAEGQNGPSARPQNIFEALFPGLIKERQKRQQATFEEVQPRPAPAPIQKISAPQYYTYKVDRLARIDLSAIKATAAPAIVPAAPAAAETELLLDATQSSASAPPAVERAPVTDAEAFASVASRFAGVSIMAEPSIGKAIAQYYSGNPKLLWLDAQLEPNARAKAALEVLSAAEKYGLDPADYAVTLPAAEAGTPEEARLDAAARFEIALTARTMRYALDAAGGLVVPNRLSGYHDFDVNHLNAQQAIEKIASGDPASVLPAFNPDNAPFRALMAELQRLDSEADDGLKNAGNCARSSGEARFSSAASTSGRSGLS
ncbi:MAG: hypothetical protein MUE79_08355, partial [Nitratireductor sp.]|nr:hypothetical protein [Nitratireductor sp.]